jgi:hypothetical protein
MVTTVPPRVLPVSGTTDVTDRAAGTYRKLTSASPAVVPATVCVPAPLSTVHVMTIVVSTLPSGQ